MTRAERRLAWKASWDSEKFEGDSRAEKRRAWRATWNKTEQINQEDIDATE